MSTAVLLFTRDLRVHDHPALRAAAAGADAVVPLFVLDEAVLGSSFTAPNRAGFLLESLAALRTSLRSRGGDLVVRRGDVAEVVARIADAVDATTLHLSADVSAYAARRLERLHARLDPQGVRVVEHPGVTIVPPGALTPSGGGDHYRVFTPYWRVWEPVHRDRVVLAPPARLRVPDGVDPGRLPSLEELAAGERSPAVARGGERAGRERLAAFLEDGDAAGDRDHGTGMAAYAVGHDDLAGDRTSRLSPYLHLGCLSPREIADRLDLRRRGHEPFLRQLCWRDFHHQVTAAHRTMPSEAYRPRDDTWRDDPEALAAWQEGRTGVPIVDAGMRQLRREGWMHNRARLIVASFLVKDCSVDWRLGAQHFFRWLVDGDIANNAANWQWVAGTGTDTRPNRILNPVAQSRRHDPDGVYIRRHVPELADLGAPAIHAPWELPAAARDQLDYPPPLVDHDAARRRFLASRGAA